jgi:hypothetical protein
MKPKLTAARWQALKNIKDCGFDIFTSLDCGVHGAALYSLEQCGWIERTEMLNDLPWQTETQGHYWWLTKEGEHVLKILPTTKPGK